MPSFQSGLQPATPQMPLNESMPLRVPTGRLHLIFCALMAPSSSACSRLSFSEKRWGGDLYSDVLTLSFQSILWEKTEGGKQELVEEPYFSHIRSGKKGRIVGIERSGNHPIPPGDPRRLSDPSVGCQGTLPDFRGCIGEQETELVWSFQPISPPRFCMAPSTSWKCRCVNSNA